LQVHGYEFGVVYLRLDKEGAGQGEIVPFGRLLPDPENGFNVERKSQDPVRLNSVRREED